MKSKKSVVFVQLFKINILWIEEYYWILYTYVIIFFGIEKLNNETSIGK